MPTKRLNAGKIELVARSDNRPTRLGNGIGRGAASHSKKRRFSSQTKDPHANEYHCAIERTQNRKYNVRVRAIFGLGGQGAGHAPRSRGGWTLSAYFLASSINGVMKKLGQSLQLLQKNEDRLRFWGVEHSDDPNLAGDLLQEFGLWLDRRKEFPRKVAEFRVPRERPVSAAVLAPVRRILADSVAQERPDDRIALAGD
jgi:hypothetical protein